MGQVSLPAWRDEGEVVAEGDVKPGTKAGKDRSVHTHRALAKPWQTLLSGEGLDLSGTQPMVVMKEGPFMKPLGKSKHTAVLTAGSEWWPKLGEKRQKMGGRRL